MDIVIKKLNIINNINLLDDVLNIIKYYWLDKEYIVILPPSVEEWNTHKKMELNPCGIHYEYINPDGFKFLRPTLTQQLQLPYMTSFYDDKSDGIQYNIGNNMVFSPKYNQLPEQNIWFNKKLFNSACYDIVPIYYFK